jgi:hypothetical protein
MEITKIDIYANQIVSVDELTGESNVLTITSEYDEFLTTFSDTQDLMSINLVHPCKRFMKFYAITESVAASFVEVKYDDLTTEDKGVFDEFVTLIQSK